MSNDPWGRLIAAPTLGMSEEEQNQLHHIELLVDIGCAQWTTPDKDVVRITNQGYDFLNAIQKRVALKENFIQLLARGIPLVNVVTKIISLANDAPPEG